MHTHVLVVYVGVIVQLVSCSVEMLMACGGRTADAEQVLETHM